MSYAQRFETIRTNYEIDMTTDPKILTSERGWHFKGETFTLFIHLNLYFSDLDALRAYCHRYCNNVRALDGILSIVNLGLLKLTQTSFKETVTPICQSLQTVLATYIPK